jgi:hypothetical protein
VQNQLCSSLLCTARKKRPEGSRDRVGGRKGASVYPWENRAAKEQEHGVNNAPTTRMHTRDFLQSSDFRIFVIFEDSFVKTPLSSQVGQQG